MDPWMASGYFLLGAGVGSLASAWLRAKRLRKLKDQQEAMPRNRPQIEEQGDTRAGRKSA
jgi:hypothetical protein